MTTATPPKSAKDMTAKEYKAARYQMQIDAITQARASQGEAFMKKLRRKHGIAEPITKETN